MENEMKPQRQVCPSCDGTGLDLYDGTLNYDGDLASCSVCDGRKYVDDPEADAALSPSVQGPR